MSRIVDKRKIEIIEKYLIYWIKLVWNIVEMIKEGLEENMRKFTILGATYTLVISRKNGRTS